MCKVNNDYQGLHSSISARSHHRALAPAVLPLLDFTRVLTEALHLPEFCRDNVRILELERNVREVGIENEFAVAATKHRREQQVGKGRST